MAKGKTSGTKVSQDKKKPTLVKEKVVKKTTRTSPKKLEITTLEDAKKHVTKSYKNPQHLEYTVLSNGHVFYGINNAAAKRVAENFGLKRFEVKF